MNDADGARADRGTADSSAGAFTNVHGDRYPAVAAELAAQLPPRVVTGTQQRTVGIARIGSRMLPAIYSGAQPVWSTAAQRLLESLGVESEWLQHHVETKLAAMMIDTRQPFAEVCINFTPCGVETQQFALDTCDKVLDDLLPPGYRLTVYGTRQDGSPFERTYGERRA